MEVLRFKGLHTFVACGERDVCRVSVGPPAPFAMSTAKQSGRRASLVRTGAWS